MSVAEFAILRLEAVDCYDLPKGARAQPGPAFISRYVPGKTWADDEELPKLENPKDVTRLVVFDNWVRNCDRHPPDLTARKPNYANVYLAKSAGSRKPRLYAIDHTHCFDRTPELTKRLANIDRVRDDGVYGLFPAFLPLIDPGELAWCKAMLLSLEPDQVRAIVGAVPPEWEVDPAPREALVELIVRRAGYVADKLDRGWGVNWWDAPAE